MSGNEASKSKPWVMTLRIEINGLELKVALRSSNTGGFRQVRCFHLPTGLEHTKTIVLAAYQDLLTEASGRDPDEERSEIHFHCLLLITAGLSVWLWGDKKKDLENKSRHPLMSMMLMMRFTKNDPPPKSD